MTIKHHPLILSPHHSRPPTRDLPSTAQLPSSLPPAKVIKIGSSQLSAASSHNSSQPSDDIDKNASLYFIGTATTVLQWHGIRILTDPNFLHAGDHVHLGPGVTATRKTNPAVDLHELPRIDAVLLSHYHADHFDQEVEKSLRRDLPIITTPHAKGCLTKTTGALGLAGNQKEAGDIFERVYDLNTWEAMMCDLVVEGPEGGARIGQGKIGAEGIGKGKGMIPRIKITAAPGKHVPTKFLQTLNEVVKAVPPVNGWIIELGRGEATTDDSGFECGYRIYISGDTLMVDELKEIPERYAGQNIDLMLIHLGGTSIPDPRIPALTVMVTMDAKQGLELVQLIKPDMTIPIHYDDYDVFLSPLEDFKRAMDEAGLSDKVVYLERGDQFDFRVKGE